jgi:hypothetical protein
MNRSTPRPGRRTLTAFVWLSLISAAAAGPAWSQINCGTLPQWSGTVPPVNQWHIFCGEWHGGARPQKGFHSRPGGVNPTTVARFNVTLPASAQGIYGGNWQYTGHPNTKFSTMFPDACSMAQVLQSILYANTNRIPCPPGAPHWAWCGTNGPAAATYCQSTNGTPMTIAGASAGSAVNTAFPLR